MLDEHNRIKTVSYDYVPAGSSAQFEKPQAFHLFSTGKNGVVKEKGFETDRLSVALEKFNDVKKLRHQNDGQILLTSNGKIIDYLGSLD